MNECKHFRRVYATIPGPWAALLALVLSACQPEPGPSSPDAPATTSAAATVQRARVAQVFAEPRRLTDFALLDHTGQAAGRDRLLGHWSLFFFGFTRCPDICPPSLSQLNAIRRQLLAQSSVVGAQVPQIVFISVDPDYDTPQRMAEYLAALIQQEELPPDAVAQRPPAYLGLTGDPRQIKALAVQMGVAYSADDPHRFHRQSDPQVAPDTAEQTEQGENTEIDQPKAGQTRVSHSGAVYLVDPEGAIRALFAPPLPSPAEMRDDLLLLLNQDH